VIGRPPDLAETLDGFTGWLLMARPTKPAFAGGRFVGRAGELVRVRELVSGASVGVGGVLLVLGEQGIGKSALLREGVAGAVGLGCRVGWGVADELRQGFPLRVMMECLGGEGRLAAGRVEGGGGWGLGGPVLPGDPVLAGAERLLAVVDRMCALSPVVLLAEDLQWADDASLVVWQRLSRAAGQLPLLVVGSLRPGPAREEVERLVRGVTAAKGVVLELRPMTADAVAELASGLVGGPPGPRLAGVLAGAGGNPLYVAELADALVRDGRVRVAGGMAELLGEAGGVPVPQSLAAAIGERLSALAPAEVGVLRWAAVLGAEFSVTDLVAVTAWPADELAAVMEHAVSAGVVAQAGGQLGFRHGLIRQALYERIPVPVREALHVQAGRVLARAGAPAERVAAQLAVAPDAAGDWIWQWLADAAGTLVHRAPQVAAELLRRALVHLLEADPRREIIEAGLVRAAFLLMQHEELERVARPLLARTTDPDRVAEVSWLLGVALGRVGRPAEGTLVVDQAVDRPGISETWQARLRARQAIALARAGQVDRAAEVAQQALAQAERTADRRAVGYALYTMSFVGYRRLEPGLPYIERALKVIGDDPQATGLRLLLLSNRGVAMGLADRHDEAGRSFQESLALAEQTGTPQLGMVCATAAEYYFEMAQWDDALAVLETGMGLPGPDHLALRMHALFVLIAGHRDDTATAKKRPSGIDDASIESPRVRAKVHYAYLARALDAERAGRLEDAMGELAPILDPKIAADMPMRHALLPALARLAVTAGDAPTADAAARAAAEEAECALPVRVAAADICRGLATGDPELMLAAADYYLSSGRLFDRARALEDAAALLAERGSQDDDTDLGPSRGAFREAARLYIDLGAEWDLRRADARLRRYGVSRGKGRRRVRAKAGWDALTPTETKIARLVAAGRSNPDIATELFLSRNTVQTHVSHILAKLGARSRNEIIRQAAERAG
jgi:DNA-binding CsgD family transcriptional regulator/tetratricopeptide (TPR) repeat protein